MMKEKPKQILCICTGNICRSPMAEHLLLHALDAEGEPLKSIRVVSAGVAASEGDPVSRNSVLALKKVGLDISRHTSRQVTAELLRESDLILGMTESHRALLSYHCDPLPAPIYLMREFHDPNHPEIPDPFGMNLAAYETARDSIVESIPAIIRFLKEEFNKKNS